MLRYWFVSLLITSRLLPELRIVQSAVYRNLADIDFEEVTRFHSSILTQQRIILQRRVRKVDILMCQSI